MNPSDFAPVLQPGTAVLDSDELVRQGRRLYDAGGLGRGQSTGWRVLDALYTVIPSQLTAIIGIPGMGKSEFLDAMLLNLAEGDDWEFAIYSPENYPPVTHLAKFAEKRVRKPFGRGPTERMTAGEYELAAEWIGERFFWIEPKLRTPDQLVRVALEMRNPGKKFGIVLDPWNTLDHKRNGMSETDYISHVLSELSTLARNADAHIWLVVHPAKMMRDRDGKRPVPTPYDMAGSAHFFNKLDNIICVHRDQAEDTQDVEIYVQKVRFKHVGRVGLAILKYDRVTGRYFEAPIGLRDAFGRAEHYADPERTTTRVSA